MTSLSERLIRSYCLFHWLQTKPIPDNIQATTAYANLEQELAQLQVSPTDLAAVGADGSCQFEEARLAFMVRYSGLTWSTCAIFCDAIEHPEWTKDGAPLLVRFTCKDPHGLKGLPMAALADFSFLNPSKVQLNNRHVESMVVRWEKHEQRRMERFLRLAAARHGVEAKVDNIAQSEKFIAAIKATVGA